MVQIIKAMLYGKEKEIYQGIGEKVYPAHAVTPPVLDYEQCALSTSAALEYTICEPARGVLRTVITSLLHQF